MFKWVRTHIRVAICVEYTKQVQTEVYTKLSKVQLVLKKTTDTVPSIDKI